MVANTARILCEQDAEYVFSEMACNHGLRPRPNTISNIHTALDTVVHTITFGVVVGILVGLEQLDVIHVEQLTLLHYCPHFAN